MLPSFGGASLYHLISPPNKEPVHPPTPSTPLPPPLSPPFSLKQEWCGMVLPHSANFLQDTFQKQISLLESNPRKEHYAPQTFGAMDHARCCN